LEFSYGVEPVSLGQLPAEWTAFTRDWVRAKALPGPVAFLVQGPSPGNPHANHPMEILQLDEQSCAGAFLSFDTVIIGAEKVLRILRIAY